MKRNIYWILLVFLLGQACKKSSSGGTLSSLNIIDATLNSQTYLLSFAPTPTGFYLNQSQLSFASSLQFGIPAGTTPFSIFSTTDSSAPVLQTTLNLKGGAIYSLYLAGVAPAVDTLLMQDILPVHADSSAGVRFINLSPDSGPVGISILGNSQNEFSNLAYKQVTLFKNYPDNNSVMSNGGYNFAVSDASGNTLTTFNWNPQVFQNNTLIICGADSLQNLQVFQVNNY